MKTFLAGLITMGVIAGLVYSGNIAFPETCHGIQLGNKCVEVSAR